MTSRTPRHITSLANEQVKAIRALDMRKARRETGLFVAEGASLLITARDNGFVPETLVVGPNATEAANNLARWAIEADSDVLEVSRLVLEKLASKDNPQSVLAVFRQRWQGLPDAKSAASDALWVVLEEVRDPGNLGTIIRTADAVGASGIILVGICCDAYSPEAVRASMGSIFAVPLVHATREAFLDWRRGWPGDVVGTHLAATTDFRGATSRAPLLLVMGSEGPGLSAEMAKACSLLVKIPMAGRLDSLNLAVATALLLYQMRGAKLST